MRNLHPVSVAAPLLTVLALSSCTTDEVADPRARNLVVITVDTLRADRLETYGYFRALAPNIDALAAESLVFERCLAPIPQTTPSHLSLMTGLYPYEHGVSNNFARLPEEEAREKAFAPTDVLRTFAQVIGTSVDTAGFVSAAPVKRLTGLANGFRTWDEPGSTRRTGDLTNAAALPWLAAQSGPFFMWVHYMDAHGPYEAGHYPPGEFETMYGVDDGLVAFMRERNIVGEATAGPEELAEAYALANLYDGSVTFADQAVGELLDALRAKGIWEETVVVLMSDHGQGLWQHYSAGHGDVWNEQLQVPLMMRVPGERPRRLDPSMSIVDVLPTALAFVRGFDSADFLEQARGQDVLSPTFQEREVFGMGDEFFKTYTLVDGDWKFIRRQKGKELLFSVSKDPFELTDLSESNPDVAKRLSTRLDEELARQRATNEAFRSGSATAVPVTDTEHIDELEDLGYMGGDEPEDEDDE